MFEHSLFNLGKFARMHDHCPYCDLNYHPEPGFYFGAAYFSYAFNIGIFVSLFVAINILSAERPPFWFYAAIILGTILVLLPLIFRLSRALMLYVAGGTKFNPDQPPADR